MKKILTLIFLLLLSSTIVNSAEVELKYRLLQGDRVAISVWGEDTLNLKDIIVLPDGSISFPLAGNIQVVGYTTEQVESIISEKLKDYLPTPKVTVVVTSVEGNKAYVIGKVLKPGPILLNTPTTVLQALGLAGGLDRFSDSDDIKVIRTTDQGQVVFKVNYDDFASGKNLESNIFLKPGDSVIVP